MGKSRRAHYSKMAGSDVFFQSATFNQKIYEMYRHWMLSMALNRFKWINLPASCDERYLEYTLFFNGMATIAFPKGHPDLVYSTQAVYAGPPNLYDNPTKWESIGNNGWRFRVSNANGVIVFDNRMRLPIAGHLDMFARRLTTIDRTFDINMLQQRTPFIVTGPQEKKNDIANVMKQIAGGEPAVAGFDALLNDIHVKVISTGVPCIADQIDAGKRAIWNDIYQFLGVKSVEQKTERMISSEVEAQTAPTELTSLDPLNARREAADAWNRRFYRIAGRADQKPLEVVWATDYRSDNFDMQNNEKERANATDGTV